MESIDQRDLSISSSAQPILQTTKERARSIVLPVVAQRRRDTPSVSRKESVYTFYQNNKLSLLYGKNNVSVKGLENEEVIKGYLSLHQTTSKSLILKWTPNYLLTSLNSIAIDSSTSSLATLMRPNLPAPVYIKIEHITHVHVHSFTEIVLVDSEGVQQFNFQLADKVHCLSFLRCLANSLAPFFALDPPVWRQENGRIASPRFGIFQKWRWSRTSTSSSQSVDSTKSFSLSIDTHEAEAETILHGDCVFRIVSTSSISNSPTGEDSKDHKSALKSSSLEFVQLQSISDNLSNFDRNEKNSADDTPTGTSDNAETEYEPIKALEIAYQSMQRDILNRAFTGWLKHCRHIKLVRSRLSGILVKKQSSIQECEKSELDFPVDENFWRACRLEMNIRVFFKGVDPKLRAQVWPYLLRLIDWNEELDNDRLEKMTEEFDKDLKDWTEMEKRIETMREQKAETNNQRGLLKGKTGNDSTLVQSIKNINRRHQIEKMQASNSLDSSCTCSDVFESSETLASEENSYVSISTCDWDVVNVEHLLDQRERQETVHEAENALMEEFDINLNRIEKDVLRCDRNTEFYRKEDNLEKLRRIMCTYIYRHLKLDLDDGYVQGMCDLLAPVLVIFKDQEVVALGCFEKLMDRMSSNFPQAQSKHKNGGEIENILNNLRAIVEIMDPNLYQQMMNHVDYTFVVFYRWLLLDFKRELTYHEVFKLWEVVWAAERICSTNFQIFFGLALLTHYREIIIDNNMDFTDVIKFFNEMAEKHNVDELLEIARNKLFEFQRIVVEMNGDPD